MLYLGIISVQMMFEGIREAQNQREPDFEPVRITKRLGQELNLGVQQRKEWNADLESGIHECACK